MKKNEKLIGKKFMTEKNGLVKVIEAVENSRVKVIVKEIDRGRGWNERTQSYTGYTLGGSWARGENYGYLSCHEININELKELENEKFNEVHD